MDYYIKETQDKLNKLYDRYDDMLYLSPEEFDQKEFDSIQVKIRDLEGDLYDYILYDRA